MTRNFFDICSAYRIISKVYLDLETEFSLKIQLKHCTKDSERLKHLIKMAEKTT